MTKPKTLEQLRTEKERAETQLAQEQHLLRLFFFPGIFTRTQSGTMLSLSAETETAHRDTPMCEERQTHSDRILPGLTSPIRSAMRETATSSLSLKHR